MKKAIKVLAALFCVCMLLSLVSIAASADMKPNSKYVEQKEWKINYMKTRPNMDGKLDEWKSQATPITFTKAALEAGDGFLWSERIDPDDELMGLEPLPDEGDGMGYLAWDEEYIYFALDVADPENTNNEAQGVDLWKGDCLQIQIGDDYDRALRYELGFALSKAMGTRRLGYQWFPIPKNLAAYEGKTNMADPNFKDEEGYVYWVEVSRGHTIYEIAVRYDFFQHKDNKGKSLAAGMKIPFAFSLHLDSNETKVDGEGNVTRKGYFMEWGDGVVGGDAEKLLNVAPLLVLQPGGDGPRPTTPPQTTTTPITTTNPVTPGSTTRPVTPGTTATPNGPTTTVAPTTTTEAPVVEGIDFYKEENATDEEGDLLDKAKEALEIENLILKKYKVGDAKFGTAVDAFAGVFTERHGKLTKVDPTVEEFDGENWNTYAVGKGTVVYVAAEFEPTTEPLEDPTEPEETPTEPEETPTESLKPTDAPKVTEPADAGTKEPGEEGGSLTWLWILLGVVVVGGGAGAAVALKKKGNKSAEE